MSLTPRPFRCIQVHSGSVLATATPSQHLDGVTLPPAAPTQHKNTIYFDQSDLINVHVRLLHGQQQQRASAYVQRP